MYTLLGCGILAAIFQNAEVVAAFASLSVLAGALTASPWDPDLIATICAVFAVVAVIAFLLTQLWVGAGLAAFCVLFSFFRFTYLRDIDRPMFW